MKRALFVLAFSLLFLIFPQNIFAHGASIHMTENGFEPSEITIEKGETVEFENLDKVPRWPASDIHPTHAIYSEFDPKSGIAPGKSWEFKFDKAGTWNLHDHLIPKFTGKIIVKGEEVKVEKKQLNFFEEAFEGFKVSVFRIFYKFFPDELDKIRITDMVEKEDKIGFYVKLLGADGAFKKLLGESANGSSYDCHKQAHIIGRVSYEIYGSEAFAKGDSSCHSGYYHGAMEAFLASEGTENLAKKITAICSQFATSFGNFECLHGVGHGVLAYENYDLPKAIEVCGSLSSGFDMESCYGGVFMENIVASQGNAAVGGHVTSWVSSDTRYPCNIFETTNPPAAQQCYMMQTSRMLTLFNYDFKKVADECVNINSSYSSTCYQSLGRDAAGHTLRDSKKIVEICGYVDSKFRQNCYNGALNVIVDFWGEKLAAQADEFCDSLEVDYKPNCHLLLNDRKKDVFSKNLQS